MQYPGTRNVISLPLNDDAVMIPVAFTFVGFKVPCTASNSKLVPVFAAT